MKQEAKPPYSFISISALHRAMGLPKPLHPLISLVDYGNITEDVTELSKGMVLDFYKISFKKNFTGKIKYGQSYYDFEEGGLSFYAPRQVIAGREADKDYSGYTLLIHPDFIRTYSLGSNIKNYGFFSYAANEALCLSDKEKTIITGIFQNIEQELSTAIDNFSQDLLISHLELLLNYSNRFYNRQFITRKTANNDLLTRLEQLLNEHFDTDKALTAGLPTVKYVCEQLHVSPRYLSDMLRSLTGEHTQQHIQNKVIEKAKEILSTSSLSVAEIAYQLGFEHPQSFNKIFKRKTNVSPIEFRESFN